MIFVIFIFTTFIAGSLSQPEWDGLRVTWNTSIADPNYFTRYPRTETEAINEGFTKIGDCDLTAKWRGRRYVRDEDYTVIVLYDVKGYIAGIQTAITKTSTYPPSKLQPPFIDDGNRVVLTAYFIDPSKICTTGRSAEKFNTQGTGTNLYLQNSTSPESSILIPSTLSAIKRTSWIQGQCVPYMGIHFFHNFTLDADCEELFPATLMYNKGRLNMFSWVFLATIHSPRYEESPQIDYPYFIKPVPRCLDAYNSVTTQHVYLTDDFTLNQC